MKAKELIKVLQEHPEADVAIQCGECSNNCKEATSTTYISEDEYVCVEYIVIR